MSRRVGHVGDTTRAIATTAPHDYTSQDKESTGKEAAMRMTGLQGLGYRVAEEHPEQSVSQVDFLVAMAAE